VSSLQERTIADGAARFMEPGEEVLAAIVAAPRGHTQSVAGAMELGAAQQRGANAAAEQAGLRLAAPMAVALTARRLLTLRIGAPIGLGIGGQVKDLLSAVPIEDVDSIEVKRLLLGKRITLSVRGASIKLEANAAAGANRLVDAFEGVKAGQR
jgi:hypothetical protein